MTKKLTETSAEVRVAIGKHQILSALSQITLGNVQFDSDKWSVGDAMELETIARLIRSEISDKKRRKNKWNVT